MGRRRHVMCARVFNVLGLLLCSRVTRVGVGSDGVNESLSTLLEEGGQAVIGYRFLASPFRDL